MDNVVSNYLALPAISRTLATATGILSFLIHVGIWNASHFIFHHSMLWKFPPQIWRVATAFMLTGPGIGLIFDTYFLYVYLVQFEVGNPRFKYKEDLIWFLLVVCGTILMTNYLTGGGYVYFLPALNLALSYTVTQDQRGAQTTYLFIPMPAQVVPYASLVISLLFPNGFDLFLLQVHGLFAGHLWRFFTRIWPEYGGGRNYLTTPALLTSIVRFAEAKTGSIGRTAGSQRPAAATGSSSASQGPLPDSWRTRGQGRRLG